MANQNDDAIGDRKWLTLGLARTLLGINEATLRQWADNGLVRAFRTPGGHRRFSAEDIHALIAGGHEGAAEGVHIDDSSVLPRIRRAVKGESRPHLPAWMERFDEEGHRRMRTLGREFLDLCIEHIEQPERTGHLETAARLGEAYGVEIASRGIPLSEALQAFFFFRNATVEAIRPTLVDRDATAGEAYAVHDLLTKLTDRVLTSMTAQYGQQPNLANGPRAKAQPKTPPATQTGTHQP